jgi:hypothetical protein
MIRARSPYIISINETSQVSTKIELFISFMSLGSTPTLNYTLSKAIPASNAPTTYYDISPYIREYFDHTAYSNVTSLTAAVSYPCVDKLNVRVKRYKTVGTTETLVDTTDYIATDGYSEFANSVNYNGGNYLLDQKNYYYHSGANAGFIMVYVAANDKIRWTNVTDSIVYLSASLGLGFYYVPRCYNSEFTKEYTVEVINSSNVMQATWTFKPVEECLYTPVKVDFINKHGAFQREFFFKASNDNIEVTNKDYNLMQPYNYSLTGGQRTTYNQNGKQSIKVNSGWVEEDFKDNLKQLMLSEKVLVDEKPAILKTKSIELNKSLNTKQINYSLEFEFAYDLINSIV